MAENKWATGVNKTLAIGVITSFAPGRGLYGADPPYRLHWLGADWEPIRQFGGPRI